ncbi:MAG: glucose-1-phosphate cytidylyltransferase [Gammaproteobacteria bacterium]|nr:glucose-1-phosphate cytidylyltransferase [Gammaproteobacteria bacterium]
MKVAILAGGRGTRLAEVTSMRPKPMVEIGGKPILWHIMNIYSHHGYSDFLIAAGYKGEMIKEYFNHFYLHNNDYIVNLADGSRELVNEGPIDWRVGVIDTGLDTLTAGRVARLQRFIGEETFMLTYGDGVGDVDISALVAFHRQHGRYATVTAVNPPARFGALVTEGDQVTRFAEKPATESGWINGGFFVFEPQVFDYLGGDQTSLEREPLERLAADGQLVAYRHHGFWQPMDTLRDQIQLEKLWENGEAAWKVWE